MRCGEGVPTLLPSPPGWGLVRAVSPIKKIEMLFLRIYCYERGNSPPNSQYTSYIYTQKAPLPKIARSYRGRPPLRLPLDPPLLLAHIAARRSSPESLVPEDTGNLWLTSWENYPLFGLPEMSHSWQSVTSNRRALRMSSPSV